MFKYPKHSKSFRIQNPKEPNEFKVKSLELLGNYQKVENYQKFQNTKNQNYKFQEL